MTHGKERRKYPRIRNSNIGISISGGGLEVLTQSLDVSASGIYCKINQKIPLMTRLQINLSFPAKNKSEGPVNMEIEGVVVREHPVMKDGKVQHYDVAIFFNVLLPKERQRLIEYIEEAARTRSAN
ncbi:MAG: PilZ domain-containing protein [Candidatus Omnitrophica bacterium]|nr:PilZ domain-containing protein [Candidatus Omnitrophota bacterium]MDD5488800.1 PilZ domain-containing protein [Candidatus Omnitrophota bacterium]